jgi:hypothetical protein
VRAAEADPVGFEQGVGHCPGPQLGARVGFVDAAQVAKEVSFMPILA